MEALFGKFKILSSLITDITCKITLIFGFLGRNTLTITGEGLPFRDTQENTMQAS